MTSNDFIPKDTIQYRLGTSRKIQASDLFYDLKIVEIIHFEK